MKSAHKPTSHVTLFTFIQKKKKLFTREMLIYTSFLVTLLLMLTNVRQTFTLSLYAMTWVDRIKSIHYCHLHKSLRLNSFNVYLHIEKIYTYFLLSGLILNIQLKIYYINVNSKKKWRGFISSSINRNTKIILFIFILIAHIIHGLQLNTTGE